MKHKIHKKLFGIVLALMMLMLFAIHCFAVYEADIDVHKITQEADENGYHIYLSEVNSGYMVVSWDDGGKSFQNFN